MRRTISFVVFGALLALSMGGTCQQETAQSVLNAFLTQIADITGQAIGEALVGGATP